MENKTHTQCESKSSRLRSYQWPQSLSRLDSKNGSKKNERRWILQPARLTAASLVVRPFLATLTQTARINSRLYVGLILLLVVAPLTNCIYTFFDSSAGFPLSSEVIQAMRAGNLPEGQWYYVNWYYFFASIGPHLFTITSLAGIFLLFPVRHISSYGIAIPLGYETGKIFWLWTVTSNSEFNRFVPLLFLLLGILFSGVVMLSARFWMDRKFHKYDGIMARIIGLIDAPGIDPETRKTYMHGELSKLKNFNSIH